MWQLNLTSVKESMELHVWYHKAAWRIKRMYLLMLAPKQRNVKPRNYPNASKSSPCKWSIFWRNDIALLHWRVGSSWCAERLRRYCGWIKPPSFLLFLQLGATVDLLHGARELASSEGTPAPLINWWGNCQRVLPRLSCSPFSSAWTKTQGCTSALCFSLQNLAPN